MPEAAAKVHITKLAAAQRQLRAAVRMFFAGEDELAVHTVASAAYRLLADLKTDRGRDEVGDFYLTSIFYCVRDFRRGTLPSNLANNPEMMAWIREMAEMLPITADSKFSDAVASVPVSLAREFWQKRNAVSNFLKHADRDAKAHIALDDVDNLQLLMHAYSAYLDFAHELEAEGLVLWLYYCVDKGITEGLPKRDHEIARKMASLDPDKRLQFCSMFIRELNSPSPTPSRGTLDSNK
jgi:hypothetical protein